MFRRLQDWITFISIITVYGKRLIELIKEINNLFDELKPELKAGKEKYDIVIETMKNEINTYWELSNNVIDKLIEWADRRIKQIVKLYNESGLFTKVEDRIE